MKNSVKNIAKSAAVAALFFIPVANASAQSTFEASAQQPTIGASVQTDDAQSMYPIGTLKGQKKKQKNGGSSSIWKTEDAQSMYPIGTLKGQKKKQKNGGSSSIWMIEETEIAAPAE